MLSRSSILFRHSRGLSAPLGVNSVPRRFAGAGFVIRPPRGFLEQLDDAPVAPEGSDDATANATGGAEAGQDRQEFLVRGLYRRYVAINQKCGAHPHPHLRPERLKPKERRLYQENARRGRIANEKIAALVELIYFKRDRKIE